MNALRRRSTDAQKDQVATQSRLADFPRFRAVSNASLAAVGAAEPAPRGRGLLQDDGRRRPRLRAAGDAEVGAGRPHRRHPPRTFEGEVDSLRETISTVEDGQRHDLSVRRRAGAQALRPAVPAVRRRARRRPPSDLRARRGDAPAAAQPADRERRRDRRLPQARRGRRRRRCSTSRGLQWLGRDRDVTTVGFGARLPRRPLGAGGRCPTRISRPRQQCAGQPALAAADRPRLLASAGGLGAPDLGQGAADRARHASRAATR